MNKHWYFNRKLHLIYSDYHKIFEARYFISEIHNENNWSCDNHLISPLKFHNFEDFSKDTSVIDFEDDDEF